MRLNRYLTSYVERLDEKVTKKEIEEIWKRGDILIGAEFEFNLDHLEDYGDNQEEYDKAYNAWYHYMELIGEWDSDRNDWESQLVGTIEGLEEEINDLEIQIEDFNEVFDTPEIKDAIKRVKEAKKELKDVEKALRLKRSYEDIEYPTPPEIPNELNDMDNMVYDSYDAGDEIPEPQLQGHSLEDEDYKMGLVEEYLKHNVKFPFSNWEVNSESSKPGEKNWTIANDGSLGETGIEVRTPPLTLSEFPKAFEKMSKWIKDNGSTDNACGFHVHLSLKNVKNLKDHIDLVKLTLFTDEELIFKFFEIRKGNTNVQSVRDKIISTGKIDKSDLESFLAVKKLESKMAASHYNAINWEGLSDDHGHIEFRYLGGKDYHRKWDSIKQIIGQYAYNLNLACNPEFKKKEYVKKIIRILNKAEMVKLKKKLVILKNVLDGVKNYDVKNKRLLKWISSKYKISDEKYKSLHKIYGNPSKRISNIDVNFYINLKRWIMKYNPSEELKQYLITIGLQLT